MKIFSFFLGVLASSLFGAIPSRLQLSSLFFFAILLLSLHRISKGFTYLACLSLGLFWALANAAHIAAWTLPLKWQEKQISIEGSIYSIPISNKGHTDFVFKVQKMVGESVNSYLHLTTSDYSHCLHVGDKWRFLVKLRKPHALSNPDTVFDVEKSFFLQHIRATGVVIKSKQNQLLNSSLHSRFIQRVRAKIKTRIINKIVDSSDRAVLIALSLGMTNDMTKAQWQLLRITGTNHLVAISGLHIGLVSYLFAKLITIIWRQIPQALLILPIPYLEAICSLVSASSYSLLAGLSSSVARALIMISCIHLAKLLKRQATSAQALIVAMGIIVLCNPFALWLPGFWLSFCAVFLLLYGFQGRKQTGLWWKWGRPQWVVVMGMTPLLLYFFHQATWLAIPANIIVIPWVSFVVVPCCLVGVISLFIFEPGGVFLLNLAVKSIHTFFLFLNWLSQWPSFVWQHAFSTINELILTLTASLISLLPKGLPILCLTVAYWLPCFFAPKDVLASNLMQLVVFDVGQGLALLVRTSHHVLIYDTGAKWQDNDMAKSVLIPYLQVKGIRKIDMLTVSHGDNDHSGGVDSLWQAFPIDQLITSVPERFQQAQKTRYPKTRLHSCEEYQHWHWDGVYFEILSPSADKQMKGNNRSCVLKISQGNQRILMTGDIEKQAEQQLVAHHKKDLRANILISPHHGSKTSSTIPFLQAVSPNFVIITCGYLNSYHHPHKEVVKRYQQLGIKILNTVDSGAIIMTLSKDSDKVIVEEYRKKHPKIWQQPPL